MILSNVEIASLFDQLADLLEIKGENTFKIRAYRNASRTIENLGTDLRKMLEEGVDISRIPTIGEHIAQKIAEIIKTGKLAKLEYLKHSFPPHLLDLLKVEGIGPKRAKILYQELNIASLDALKKAAEKHQIRTLKGFSEKLEKKILKGTILAKKEGKRFMYSVAEPYADALATYLKNFKGALDVTVAGSFRRRKETVGDLNDIYIKKAKEAGVRFAISTDAHNAASLHYMKYGVYQARRGWLEKEDVINTLTLEELKKALQR